MFVLVSAALLFSGHQEIIAQDSPYDDYYFLMRSESFGLMGSHLASLREYLYSLFIQVSRLYGVSLRNFEVVCYAIALTWLWGGVRKLTRSAFVAWVSVFPLALFTYQSPVFNATEYDALQLVLTPCTIASAVMVYRQRGSLATLLVAGLVAAAQVLTRPEGVLFLLPPFVALAFVALAERRQGTWRKRGLRYLGAAVAVCVMPVVAQQGISAANYVTFGFWAPTLLKSSAFTGAEKALMSIRPAASDDAGRYAPVPVSSMYQAYRASPAFRKADVYFADNLGGKGWSSWAPPGYGTHDGSIDGGHFPFALVEASARVAGPRPRDMLAYLATVTRELDSAFDRGELQRRRVLSAELGPNFSLLNPHYWRSVWLLSRNLLDLNSPEMPFGKPMPGVAYRWRSPQIEANYDYLALRRTALLYANDWTIDGWVLNRKLGSPDRIFLSEPALVAGIGLKLIDRPDVAKVVLGLPPERAAHALVGYRLYVPDAFRKILWEAPQSPEDAISVNVQYGSVVTRIPVSRFIASHGAAFSEDMVEVQEEQVVKPRNLMESPEYLVARRISKVANRAVGVLFVLALPLLVGAFLVPRWFRGDRAGVRLSVLVACVAFSLILPRIAMLAGVDAFMFPGQPPRYLAAAAFAMWFFALFVVAWTLYGVGGWVGRRARRPRRAPACDEGRVD